MGRTSRSGIYLLPNLLTTASLFAAFYSLVSSMKGHFDEAAFAIFVGMIADGLDGRIARLTNTQTKFGEQYDSLSDLVTFGVAPSILLYSLTLNQLGKIGWLVAFIYTAAVTLRLARFNTQIETADKRYFQGLPCPTPAIMMAALALLHYQNQWQNIWISVCIAFLAFFVSVLMVSNLRYYSFKEVDFKGKVPFLYVLVMIIFFVAIAAHPAIVLFLGSAIYVFSGPALTLISLHKMRKQRRNALK